MVVIQLRKIDRGDFHLNFNGMGGFGVYPGRNADRIDTGVGAQRENLSKTFAGSTIRLLRQSVQLGPHFVMTGFGDRKPK